MTAPVLQRSGADSDSHLVSFVLPLSYTMETAPEPEDPRISLRRIPARTVAAVRYSGFWSAANYREHESQLLGAVADSGYEPTGSPEWARYNAPFVPWFMRRNEVLVEVRKKAAAN